MVGVVNFSPPSVQCFLTYSVKFVGSVVGFRVRLVPFLVLVLFLVKSVPISLWQIFLFSLCTIFFPLFFA